MVDNEPYEIKGVTIGFVDNTESYDEKFKDLQFLGVNTVRTWATSKHTEELLDAAHAHGIKVFMGIWMRHGRPGMEDDDSFNYLEDKQGKDDMYQNALQVVKKYKDHPAVLAWSIGNEVYLNTATDEEKIAYSQLLEKIAQDIKKEDPNHPVASVGAWTFGFKWWQEYVPSLDIYGLNSYGIGASFLADELKKHDIDKAYIVTEFGVTGEWDIEAMINGVKVEPNDTEKYDAIATGYHQWIANKPANLGAFVFHYANEKNHMAPWLLTHFDSKKRPQYWAIREAYTGEKPTNYVPVIPEFSLPAQDFDSENWVPVTLKMSDKENEDLTVSFAYNQRTGSRKRRDQISPLQHRGNMTDGYEILTPKEDGSVKIYAMVSDAENIGIASTGIIIKDEETKNKKHLVPKVSLPFYVYKDGENQPYLATNYMGNMKAMTVAPQSTEDVYDGKAALKISYDADSDWYGLGLVDPANDWGDILGGYDISGAKKFSFKPFPDSAKKSVEIKLTTKWKKYSISTKKLDLSCIRSGLVIFTTAYGMPQDIYIDNVVFE